MKYKRFRIHYVWESECVEVSGETYKLQEAEYFAVKKLHKNIGIISYMLVPEEPREFD